MRNGEAKLPPKLACTIKQTLSQPPPFSVRRREEGHRCAEIPKVFHAAVCFLLKL